MTRLVEGSDHNDALAGIDDDWAYEEENTEPDNPIDEPRPFSFYSNEPLSRRPPQWQTHP
jgi:hypothetical protein